MSRRVILACDWCEHRSERLEDDEDAPIDEQWFRVFRGDEEWDFCSSECLDSFDFPL